MHKALLLICIIFNLRLRALVRRLVAGRVAGARQREGADAARSRHIAAEKWIVRMSELLESRGAGEPLPTVGAQKKAGAGPASSAAAWPLAVS